MTKEKTPMKELIDNYNKNGLTNGFIDWLNDNQELLLKKEKQMVVVAWNNGASETVKERISGNELHPECKYESCEQYFNDTYEQ